MGANNVIPSVPSFSAGAPSIADLNALSYAVGFLVNQDTRPTWTAFMSSGTQSATANAWTSISFDHVALDSDGVFGASNVNLPAAVIVTQGFYAFEACFQLEANTNDDQYTGAFLFTAGANNIHLTTGTTRRFGFRGSCLSNTGQAAADNATCLSSWFPTCLYPGDKINVQVYSANNTHTLDKNSNTSYIQGRFVPKFSGYLRATGS